MIKKAESKLTDERNSFKPFNYPWAYDAWLKHEQSHWLHTEVPMIEDVKDWKKRLTNEERQFLTHIFRFFTQGDIDVAGGINNHAALANTTSFGRINKSAVLSRHSDLSTGSQASKSQNGCKSNFLH
mgnify:CR=1 FL=1